MTYDTIDNDVTMAGGAQGTLLANRYRIVKQLGQGGMGSVWLAEDTQLDNKPFAIKMLPSILVSNKRAYRQLKDEALVAMKLVHPNIVQLRAFEENNGNPFLVMDYIDGETLDDCLSGWGILTVDETARLLSPVAAALDYAHAKGVVHRDVKPGNVMVAKDGTPYILDFGIAREIQETMTRVTSKLSSGTLLYMSPEQLNGDAPKKEQDIYSFAAMAYECIKGEPPFVRGAIEDQIKNKVPEPPAGLGDPSAPLVAGIMSGLAKKPEDRPPTCAAVLNRSVVSRRAAVPVRVGAGNPVPEDDGPERPSVGLGRVLAILGILAALVAGSYCAWTKYDRGVQARIARENQLAEERIAKLKAEKEKELAETRRATADKLAKLEAEKKAIEEEKRRIAEERGMRTSAVKAGEAAARSLAEQEARQKEVARLAELRVDIGIKIDDTKEKMDRIAAYRGEPDGFKAHIDNAEAKWKAVNTVDRQPTTVAEAEAALKLVSNAEVSIARELQWLKANKAARAGAKAIAAEIVREVEPALREFKASDYARVMFDEGERLRREGGDAMAEGEFQLATQKLEAAKQKLLEAAANAKTFCINTHLALAKKNLDASRWQQCAEECDTVLGWDATNAEAKKLKAGAESNLVPTAKVVVKVNGMELKDGETVRIGSTDWKTPIVWGAKNIKAGSRYGGKVSYESGGKIYIGSIGNFTVDWRGLRTFTVALKEYTGPNDGGGKILSQPIEDDDDEFDVDWIDEHSRRILERSRINPAPTAKVIVKVNGSELKDGETVRIGSIEWKTPIVWGAKNITKGSRYGGEVAYEKNGRSYFGRLDDFTIDWPGPRTFTVALREYTGPKHGDVKTLTLPGGATMEMIYVGPGTFTMGSPSSEYGRDSGETQHRVALTKGFWLGKYEVTQKQWQSVMGSNPSVFKGDNNPVENVSWNDCQEFVRKVNDAARYQFGGGARLPTEAEWEYACRAGTSGAYAGTERLDDMGWYGDNSGRNTHPVGQKRPNAWGFCDMHGNVWEWCQDWYGSYGGNVTDPSGPDWGDYRVLRGGCWNYDARVCRSAGRSRSRPGSRSGGNGFRLCCSAGPRE